MSLTIAVTYHDPQGVLMLILAQALSALCAIPPQVGRRRRHARYHYGYCPHWWTVDRRPDGTLSITCTNMRHTIPPYGGLHHSSYNTNTQRLQHLMSMDN